MINFDTVGVANNVVLGGAFAYYRQRTAQFLENKISVFMPDTWFLRKQTHTESIARHRYMDSKHTYTAEQISSENKRALQSSAQLDNLFDCDIL